MDAITKNNSIMVMDSALITIIKKLFEEKITTEAVIADLQDFLADPDGSSVTAKLAAGLGVNTTRIKDYLDKYKDKLHFFLKRLDELCGREESWSLAKSGKNSSGSNTVQLDLSADAEASIEVDCDGSLIDGAFEYDPEQFSYLRIGVGGKIKGGAKAAAKPVGTQLQAAFGNGAGITLNNYFRHPHDQLFYKALWYDLPSFVLPATAGGPPSPLLPGQLVQLHGEGTMEIGAALNWSHGFMAKADISDKTFDFSETLGISAGVEASASFSYTFSGNFDILISRSEENYNWLCVELSKCKTSESKNSFSLEASLGIEGVDKIGGAILNNLTKKFNALVEALDKTKGSDENLQNLLSAAAGGTDKKKFDEMIDKWLSAIAKDNKLKTILEEVLKEAAVDHQDKLIKKLGENIDKFIKPIKDLIGKYQEALKKITSIIDRAASLKVGLSLTRAQKRMEKEEIALRILIDPAAKPEAYRKMLSGDFDEALRLARDGDPYVVIKGGYLRRSGSLNIAAAINVTVFGLPFSSASILAQEWEAEVSNNGDVAIGVMGMMKGIFKSWRSVRTASLLADTQLLGKLGKADTLTDIHEETMVKIELTNDFCPSIGDLEGYLRSLLQINVIPDTTSLVKELTYSPEKKNKFGTLRCSVLLELDENMLGTILDSGAKAADVFAANILNIYVSDRRFKVYDDDKLPFLRWPDTLDFFKKGDWWNRQSSVKFAHGKEKVVFQREELEPIHFYYTLVKSFETMLDRLRELRSMSLAGLTPDAALDIIKKTQQRVLKAAGPLVNPGILFKGPRLNDALFKTLLDLVVDKHDVDPYLVVIREEDDQVFVLG